MAPDTGGTRRTGLVLIVPEAEPVVAPFRAVHDAESVARRIPAHVTVLFPFAPATDVDPLLDDVRAHFAEVAPFDASLDAVERFDDHVWLATAPNERFVDLILATRARFPDFPPYGGQFGDSDPVPHLTVGGVGAMPLDATVAAAERDLAPHLPVAFRVDAAWLVVEQADDTWRPAEHFPFRR